MARSNNWQKDDNGQWCLYDASGASIAEIMQHDGKWTGYLRSSDGAATECRTLPTLRSAKHSVERCLEAADEQKRKMEATPESPHHRKSLTL